MDFPFNPDCPLAPGLFALGFIVGARHAVPQLTTKEGVGA
jgi:hypothetical protein